MHSVWLCGSSHLQSHKQTLRTLRSAFCYSSFLFCEFFCWIVMTTVSSWRHFILLPQTDYFYHLCLLIEAFKVTALDLCSTPSPTTKPGQRLGVWIPYSFNWKLRKSEVILWSLMVFGVGLNCMKWSNWVIDSM